MARNKFNFGDVVKIIPYRKVLKEYHGREGLVIGIGMADDNPIVSYGVAFFDEQDEMDDYVCFFEKELEATGKKDDPKKIKSSTHLRVSKDGKILDVYDDEEEI